MASRHAPGPVSKFRRPAKQVAALSEVGYGGPSQFGGTLNEEFHPNLKGTQGIKIYKEMWLNDPTLGAVMLAVTMLMRQTKWYARAWLPPEAIKEPIKDEKQSDAVVAKVASEGDKSKAEFLQSCMDDMSHTWEDMVCECLTMLPFGWAWLETVYKRRDGSTTSASDPASKYTDGKIGWRKHSLRAQDTLSKWVFDPNGGIQAMKQRLTTGGEAIIPIGKSLLFRTMTYKGSPEGRSIFRNAYRPWYFKKRIEEIEGIGAERDLSGMPILTSPEGLDLWNSNDPIATQQKNEAEKIVRNVRRDEQEGILLPFGWVFALASAQGGGKRVDTNMIINRYDSRLAMTALADFILMGQQGGGSMALATEKTHYFAVAVDGWMKMIQSVLNAYAVPRLFAVNGETDLSKLPSIEYEDIEVPDLDALGNFIGRLSLSGFKLFPNPVLERYLLRTASMPVEGVEVGRDKAKEDAEMKLDQMERAAELAPDPVAPVGGAGMVQNTTTGRASRPKNPTGDPYRNRGKTTRKEDDGDDEGEA